MDSLPATLQPGLQMIEAGDLDEALAFFQDAVTRGDDVAAAYFGYGRVCFEQREFNEAIECFDLAIRKGHDHPDAYLYRAWTGYFGTACEQDRIDDATVVLQTIPDHTTAHFLIGDALADLDEYEQAIEKFNDCLNIKPNWCEPYYHWARCLSNLDDDEGAREKYIASAQFETTDENIYHHRAHYFNNIDDVPRALADFNRGLELSPDSDWHSGCRNRMLEGLGWDGEMDPVEFVTKYGPFDEESDEIMMEKRYLIFDSVREHFGDAPIDEIEIIVRNYAFRAGPDVQIAFDEIEKEGYELVHFFLGEKMGHNQPPSQFSEIYNKDRRNPVVPVSPSYQDFDIGEEKPLRCLKFGIWMLRDNGTPLHVLLYTDDYQGLKIEVAVPNNESAEEVAQRFFDYLNRMIEESRCYRGKVLSLESKEMYSGTHAGIMVHKLKPVARREVVLPTATFELIERNTVRFAEKRKRLKELGMSTKKGLLFYGPPGNGKTHTIRYLSQLLEGHTVLLITGEQIGNLQEYMTLARMLQPSVVVLEDVDLIARDRSDMRNSGEEAMLNKLLNEMDGTKSDAEILFILTTNRPAILEKALTARPGRIDQAIEFPLPDEDGRGILTRLYSHGVTIEEELVDHIVANTNDVSASFIRELMRRSVQYAIDRDVLAESLTREDIDSSLDELFTSGGSLNRALLGASSGDES